MFKYLIVLISPLILASCGKVDYGGQVFTGEGASLSKGSGTDLYILNSAFNESNISEENIAIAGSAYTEKVNKHVKNKSIYDDLIRVHSSLVDLEKWLKPVDHNILPNGIKRLESFNKQMQESEVALNTEYDLLMKGTHPLYYYGKKPHNPELVVNTDSNGNFRFSLKDPKGRTVATQYKDKFWFIKLPSNGGDINLSDKNSSGTNCDTCLLDKLVLPVDSINAIKSKLNAPLAKDAPLTTSEYRSLNDEVIALTKHVKNLINIQSQAEINYNLASGIGGLAGIQAKSEVKQKYLDASSKLLTAREKLKTIEEVFSKAIEKLVDA